MTPKAFKKMARLSPENVTALEKERDQLKQQLASADACSETLRQVIIRAREMMLVMNGMTYPSPQQTRKYEVFKLCDAAIESQKGTE